LRPGGDKACVAVVTVVVVEGVPEVWLAVLVALGWVVTVVEVIP
jgi:hypothetical protein